MKLLKDETEIASVAGPGVSAKLTSKRVIFESGTANAGEIRIIPLQCIDSFAVIASQNILLLVLGILVAFVGSILMIQGSESGGAGAFLVAGLLIAGWWFTRRIGAFIYSLSGQNEIFVGARANRQAIIDFLNEVQQALSNN